MLFRRRAPFVVTILAAGSSMTGAFASGCAVMNPPSENCDDPNVECNPPAETGETGDAISNPPPEETGETGESGCDDTGEHVNG